MPRATSSPEAKTWSGTRTPDHTNSQSNSGPLTLQETERSWALPTLLALCGALLGKSLRGGLATVGGLNLGGTLDPVHNAASVAELAAERGATALLIPISARSQLNELPDELATKLSILYYSDAKEALLKALGD